MTIFETQNRWLRPAAIIVSIVAIIIATRQQTAPLAIAPSESMIANPTARAVNAVKPLEGAFDARAQDTAPASSAGRAVAAMTDNTRLYTSAGSYSADDVMAMSNPIETAIAYVQERTGMRLAQPVNVVFDRRPEMCGLDAVAYTQARTLILYACPDTPQQRATNILAHEIVHQLAQDHYGAEHLEADLLLSEGLATWGAGRYWLGGTESFHDFVAINYRDSLLPLTTDPRGGVSINTMNQIYYQWASYVEWVHATYGAETLERLYAAGKGRQPGSADYAATLGISFADSEARWRDWLDQPTTDNESGSQ